MTAGMLGNGVGSLICQHEIQWELTYVDFMFSLYRHQIDQLLCIKSVPFKIY